jgi:phosphoribosylformylglycinamidine synthase
MRSGVGARVALPIGADPLWELFGESTSRALITCRPEELDRLLDAAGEIGVPAQHLGSMGGSSLEIRDTLHIGVDDLVSAFEGAIPSLMDR